MKQVSYSYELNDARATLASAKPSLMRDTYDHSWLFYALSECERNGHKFETSSNLL